jgi:hypothetical protein
MSGLDPMGSRPHRFHDPKVGTLSRIVAAGSASLTSFAASHAIRTRVSSDTVAGPATIVLVGFRLQPDASLSARIARASSSVYTSPSRQAMR